MCPRVLCEGGSESILLLGLGAAVRLLLKIVVVSAGRGLFTLADLVDRRRVDEYVRIVTQ